MAFDLRRLSIVEVAAIAIIVLSGGCTRLRWVFHFGRTMKARCAETSATAPRVPGAAPRSPGFAVTRGVVLRVAQLAQGVAPVDIYQTKVPLLSSTIWSRLSRAHLTHAKASEGTRIGFFGE